MPCNRRTFSKKDAVITYSHDDECFYVAEVQGAQEFNREYQELSGDAAAGTETDIPLYLAQGTLPSSS